MALENLNQKEWAEETTKSLKNLENEVKTASEKRFDNICERNTLSDWDVKWLVNYVMTNIRENKYPQHTFFTLNIERITDKQAEYLSELPGVAFSNLSIITNKQAEYLSKIDELWLNWLRRITDIQAKILSKVKNLELRWVRYITDEQAKILSKVRRLDLRKWLRSITDTQAYELAKVKNLWISKKSLTKKQRIILANKHLAE